MMHKTKFFKKIPLPNILIFQGYVAFTNINMDIKMTIATFPAGIYLTKIRFYDNYDDNIYTLKLITEIISKDRKEFK